MRTTGTGGSGRGATSGRGTDRDGAVRLSARLTPDEGARLLAEVDGRCTEMERDARAGGGDEGHDAPPADALVDLARTPAGDDRPAGAAAAGPRLGDHEAPRPGPPPERGEWVPPERPTEPPPIARGP